MAKNIKYVEDLKETRTFLNKVRTINEAMTFDEDYDIGDSDYNQDNTDDEEEIMLMGQENQCTDGICDSDLPNEIDAIREITLKGMLKFAKNSKSPEYETLKKIFQFCDKVNNEKPEEKE